MQFLHTLSPIDRNEKENVKLWSRLTILYSQDLYLTFCSTPRYQLNLVAMQAGASVNLFLKISTSAEALSRTRANQTQNQTQLLPRSLLTTERTRLPPDGPPFYLPVALDKNTTTSDTELSVTPGTHPPDNVA